jgi:uncharacterized protein (TIGR03790 family)
MKKGPFIALLALTLLLGGTVWAQDRSDDLAERTVVLVNSRQPESVALGQFYLEQRSIPRANLIALPMPDEETVKWSDFVDSIWQPLQDELLRRGWLEGFASEQLDAYGRRRTAFTGHRIAYLVVCRGTPLRIHHDPTKVDESLAARVAGQFRTNGAAVDSELALLAQASPQTIGFVPNPLFNQRHAAEVSAGLVVKVARVDGPTLAAARSLVQSAIEAEKQGLIGRYYVDLTGPHATGDQWLEATRSQLNELGYFGDVHSGPGMFDVADRFDAPAFYFGWYGGDVNGPFLRDGFRFPPGAIALHIHSFSAPTLRTADRHWAGPLVARGVAATFGNVSEPYLEFTLRPDLLLQQLAAGATLGDAACFATPVFSWQAIVLGDPLYRPFKVSLEEQVARLSEYPASLAGHVAARKAAVLEKLGMDDEARAMLTRGRRNFPSLSLSLASARFELSKGNPGRVVEMLKFVGLLPGLSLADWPLVRAAAELLLKHGSARDALPAYLLLARAPAPSATARLLVVNEARRVAEAAGNMSAALEMARLAAELTPMPPESIKGGK